MPKLKPGTYKIHSLYDLLTMSEEEIRSETLPYEIGAHIGDIAELIAEADYISYDLLAALLFLYWAYEVAGT